LTRERVSNTGSCRFTQYPNAACQRTADNGRDWALGATLGQVERGQRDVTLHNILKLAEVLGVDPGELGRGLCALQGPSR
jgi:Helix-turn-helix